MIRDIISLIDYTCIKGSIRDLGSYSTFLPLKLYTLHVDTRRKQARYVCLHPIKTNCRAL